MSAGRGRGRGGPRGREGRVVAQSGCGCECRTEWGRERARGLWSGREVPVAIGWDDQVGGQVDTDGTDGTDGTDRRHGDGG